jgi:hypothetical protein
MLECCTSSAAPLAVLSNTHHASLDSGASQSFPASASIDCFV